MTALQLKRSNEQSSEGFNTELIFGYCWQGPKKGSIMLCQVSFVISICGQLSHSLLDVYWLLRAGEQKFILENQRILECLVSPNQQRFDQRM